MWQKPSRPGGSSTKSPNGTMFFTSAATNASSTLTGGAGGGFSRAPPPPRGPPSAEVISSIRRSAALMVSSSKPDTVTCSRVAAGGEWWQRYYTAQRSRGRRHNTTGSISARSRVDLISIWARSRFELARWRTVPGLSMAMLVTPVDAMIPLIVSPPLPMIRPTMSGSTVSLTKRGTEGGRLTDGVGMASFIRPRMCSRPRRACKRA